MVVFCVDFFSDECTGDAVEECSEFRPEVPLSQQFDSKAFEWYCRLVQACTMYMQCY